MCGSRRLDDDIARIHSEFESLRCGAWRRLWRLDISVAGGYTEQRCCGSSEVACGALLNQNAYALTTVFIVLCRLSTEKESSNILRENLYRRKTVD